LVRDKSLKERRMRKRSKRKELKDKKHQKARLLTRNWLLMMNPWKKKRKFQSRKVKVIREKGGLHAMLVRMHAMTLTRSLMQLTRSMVSLVEVLEAVASQ
jgi:hypothetical protein